MNNRRNFYRILRVQPDATFDVIQQSYRSLMQKLRLHPDLGGEDRNARLINQAYSILRNPKLRATYDAKLLNQYNIKTLSTGGCFNSNTTTSILHETPHTNQRNYYRVLNIQNDAELEIIQASYRVLSTQLNGKKLQLLIEAFAVVGDQIRRLQYDALLRLHTHATSAEKLKKAQLVEKQSFEGSAMAVAISTTRHKKKLEINQETTFHKAYESAIEHFCQFCKTPYTHASFMGQKYTCTECSSPLSSPSDIFASTPRRSLPRIKQSEKADIYVHWPKCPTQVALNDLSPTGLNFSTQASLDIHQIIKVDAPHFKAIAQIAYCHNDYSTYRIGASFLTIEFLRTTGSFLSASA